MLICVPTPLANQREPDLYERVVREAELVLDLRGVTRGIEAANLVRM